jgi:hypothetical protein
MVMRKVANLKDDHQSSGDSMNEMGFNADVIEAVLAHSDKNKVRKAYNRSTYLSQRDEFMSWWGDHIYLT